MRIDTVLLGLEMEWKTSMAKRHPMSCFFEAIRHRHSILGWWTFLEKPCLMPPKYGFWKVWVSILAARY
jgi:hypothetical protein